MKRDKLEEYLEITAMAMAFIVLYIVVYEVMFGN
jgi:hypothetical protein